MIGHIIKGRHLRFIIRNNEKRKMPMQYFTQEMLSPSERTIELIKQIAYAYNVVTAPDGAQSVLFLN